MSPKSGMTASESRRVPEGPDVRSAGAFVCWQGASLRDLPDLPEIMDAGLEMLTVRLTTQRASRVVHAAPHRDAQAWPNVIQFPRP
jgi:hypothetical protein